MPPIATFISWNPRHTPNTGTPSATARGISDNVVASRCGSCSVPGTLAGPAYRAGSTFDGLPGKKMPSTRARISVTSSGDSSTGISSGRQSAAWTIAAMYFSPTA